MEEESCTKVFIGLPCEYAHAGAWFCERGLGCSDDMKEACDLVDLSWVLRKALKLLDTLEVRSWYVEA